MRPHPLFRLGLLFVAAVSVLVAQKATDASGVVFAPPHPVRRIVSLAPSLTEEIFALGAGDEIVGDTNYCRYPAAAMAKTKVGSLLSPNLELMVALRPDLVVATIEGNRQATVEQLRRLGLPVFVLGAATSLADIEAQFRVLAGLLGRASAGARILGDTDARVAAVKARVAGRVPVRAFIVVDQDPLVSANRTSFLDEIVRDAGGTNVVAGEPARYPHLNREAVLQLNPEAILITDEQAEPARAVATWMRFPELAAARSHRVFLVPSHIFGTPTPMTFAAAVETAATLLHPGTQ